MAINISDFQDRNACDRYWDNLRRIAGAEADGVVDFFSQFVLYRNAQEALSQLVVLHADQSQKLEGLREQLKKLDASKHPDEQQRANIQAQLERAIVADKQLSEAIRYTKTIAAPRYPDWLRELIQELVTPKQPAIAHKR